jgi:site-specific recombinase XerC
MEPIEREMSRLLDSSLAKNTRLAYKNSVDNFMSFRFKFGLGYTWPASCQQIAAYIAYLSLQGFSASTICSRLSGIAFLHKVNGWIDPSDNFLVKKLKEGCKRQKCTGDSRCPITLPILQRLLQVLQGIYYNAYEVAMFKAAFTLAFFGFLRVGEFAKTPHVDIDRVLSIGDITLSNEQGGQLLVHLRFSKMDQTGKGEVIHIPSNAQSGICPVSAIRQYLLIRPKVEGPLFVHFSGKPLSHAQCSSLLKKSVKAIGLNPSHFSPHSFRIGAATSAAAAGTDIKLIKEMGRWHSQSVLTYIRPNREIHMSCFRYQ